MNCCNINLLFSSQSLMLYRNNSISPYLYICLHNLSIFTFYDPYILLINCIRIKSNEIINFPVKKINEFEPVVWETELQNFNNFYCTSRHNAFHRYLNTLIKYFCQLNGNTKEIFAKLCWVILLDSQCPRIKVHRSCKVKGTIRITSLVYIFINIFLW